jgi:hypothetical protein
MKTLIITLLFLGLTISSYLHEDRRSWRKELVQDLPAVVIKSVGDDFSVYPRHECWSKVRTLEDSFYMILGKSWRLWNVPSMEIKGGSLSVYNENGKLISVIENIRM